MPLPALIAALLFASCLPAFAHGSERGLVMLLPTGFATAGGAIAVALSFVVIALIPAALLRRLAQATIQLIPGVMAGRHVLSCLSFLALAGLVLIGFIGTHDPLENLLPLSVWTIWWVGFTLAQALLGNLWPWLNPWTGPLATCRALGIRNLGRVPLVRLPKSLGYGGASVIFFLFAWFELISLSPQDPPELAAVVALYWLATFMAMVVFGIGPWTERGEPFSIFFRLIGMLAPVARTRLAGHPGRRFIALVWPGGRCAGSPPLPLSGTLFILLTLASVSFDGFSFTFTWLGSIGINPLEFPGRSAVVLPNTIGLLASAVGLSAVFYIAVWLGNMLAGTAGPGSTQRMAGHLVYSVIPISIAFHFSHYLTILLINGQYFLLALSDPLSLGWHLFGSGHDHVTTSFTSNIDSVRVIWAVQTAVIVGGHVIGILLAHMIALARIGNAARAARSQIPLATAMVFYTVFGLWLLSTPVAG